jgi:hypothetical protein
MQSAKKIIGYEIFYLTKSCRVFYYILPRALVELIKKLQYNIPIVIGKTENSWKNQG